jgi:hypothetical protein
LTLVTVMFSALSWGFLRPVYHRASSAFVARMVLMNEGNGEDNEAIVGED